MLGGTSLIGWLSVTPLLLQIHLLLVFIKENDLCDTVLWIRDVEMPLYLLVKPENFLDPSPLKSHGLNDVT